VAVVASSSSDHCSHTSFAAVVAGHTLVVVVAAASAFAASTTADYDSYNQCISSWSCDRHSCSISKTAGGQWVPLVHWQFRRVVGGC